MTDSIFKHSLAFVSAWSLGLALILAGVVFAVYSIHNTPRDVIRCELTTVVDEESALSISHEVTRQVQCRVGDFIVHDHDHNHDG